MSLNLRFWGLGMVLPLLLLIGCVEETEGRHLWQELEAADGVLRIEYADPPAFGPHVLYFSYLPEGGAEAQDLGEWELDNDGANLGEHNLEVVQAHVEGVQLVLKGQQQEDMVLMFTVVDGVGELMRKVNK